MNIKKTLIACAFVAASSSPAFAAVTATATASGDFVVNATSTVSMVINPVSSISTAAASVAQTHLGSFTITGNGELAVKFDSSIASPTDINCAELNGLILSNKLKICLGAEQGVYGNLATVNQDGQDYLKVGSTPLSGAAGNATAYFVSNQHGQSVAPDSYKVTLNAISYIL